MKLGVLFFALLAFLLVECQAVVVLRHEGKPNATQGLFDTGHSMIFVGGLHRSGTTLITYLLGTHPNVAGILDAKRFQNEGQHLQKIIPSDGQVDFEHLDADPRVVCGVTNRLFPRPRGPVFFRGKFNHVLFATAGRAHLTEQSELCSEKTAEDLFNSWKPHWNTSKQFLVEKSPINMIRTRFLQELYGPDDTKFVVTVRHPLTSVPAMPDCTQFADVENYIQQFILAWRVYLHEDLPLVKSLFVLRFEDLLSEPLKMSRILFEGLGLSQFKPPLSAGFKPGSFRGRRPLNFHGRYSKDEVTLAEANRDQWINNWINVEKGCAGMADRFVELYEHHLRPFGYSFRAPYILPTDLADVFPKLTPSFGSLDDQDNVVWAPGHSSVHEHLQYRKFMTSLESCA